jgi:hypothetical protein
MVLLGLVKNGLVKFKGLKSFIPLKLVNPLGIISKANSKALIYNNAYFTYVDDTKNINNNETLIYSKDSEIYLKANGDIEIKAKSKVIINDAKEVVINAKAITINSDSNININTTGKLLYNDREVDTK